MALLPRESVFCEQHIRHFTVKYVWLLLLTILGDYYGLVKNTQRCLRLFCPDVPQKEKSRCFFFYI